MSTLPEDALSPMRLGTLDAVDDEGLSPFRQREKTESAHVTKLLQQIEDGRKFDEAAYAAMAKDRLYARGVTGTKIKVNLIQSYIDTWVAILYARDPDQDVQPSEAVSQRGREDARQYAKTLEVVISKMWKRGKIKRQAIKWVRAALTLGVGWLRVTWQQRTLQDPVIKAQMDDIQDNLKRLVAMKAAMEEGAGAYADAELEEQEYKVHMEALEAKVERVISRGMAFDFIRSEDVTVSNEVESCMDYLDAPWVDIRTYKSFDQACALFPEIPRDVMKTAALYSRIKPVQYHEERRLPGTNNFTGVDADMYQGYAQAASDAVASNDCAGSFVCIHEMEHRDSGNDYTLIEGLKVYARPPIQRRPYAMRFYTIFGLTFCETDGLRYPESLNTRSHSLQDEFTSLESRLATHRQRVIPKILFNMNKIGAGSMRKITDATVNEHVGVKVNGNIDLAKLLYVPMYPPIDMGLYDTSNIRSNLEIIWGTQEAVMGPVQVAKTATEAKIQEAGTGARTSSKRDAQDDALTEIAQYTAEIVMQVLDVNDARALAGPEAIWPEVNAPEDLDGLVNVQIRAGSSGKPDTQAEIERWSELMPLLTGAIKEIAMLRQSDPLEVADKLEAIVEETVDRFGDHIDIARLIPQVPEMTIDPVTGAQVPAHALAAAGPGTVPGPDGAPMPAPMPEGEAGGVPLPGQSGPVGPDNVQPLVQE